MGDRAGASQPGIEIFAVPDRTPVAPRRVKFVAVDGGAEGLATSASSGAAYTHAGSDLVVVDRKSRTVTERRETGWADTHGFPRVDDQDGVVLASCADDGKVTLLDLDDGEQLASYEIGGGDSLLGYSADADCSMSAVKRGPRSPRWSGTATR